MKAFISYCHKDEDLRDQLENHLAMIKRTSPLNTWHDRKIFAGQPLASHITAAMEDADIILFLVSAEFLASAYCYDIEVQYGMERHRAGKARVIPIILRPCDWHNAPFGGLLAAPRDGKPITSWANRDEAFVNVAIMVKQAIANLQANTTPPPTPTNHTELLAVQEEIDHIQKTVKDTLTARCRRLRERAMDLYLLTTAKDARKNGKQYYIDGIQNLAREQANGIATDLTAACVEIADRNGSRKPTQQTTEQIRAFLDIPSFTLTVKTENVPLVRGILDVLRVNLIYASSPQMQLYDPEKNLYQKAAEEEDDTFQISMIEALRLICKKWEDETEQIASYLARRFVIKG